MIWFNLQTDITGNGLPNIKDTFAESFHLQMSVLEQGIYMFKVVLSTLSDGWENINKKYLMCQILIIILK